MTTVSEIEQVLYQAFPRDLAEEWDRPGLSVGNPHDEVHGVACALDVTPESIGRAAERGCDVLVTHHPVFLDPPAAYSADALTSSLAGACVYQAARLGISLIAMHTNLDRSRQALELLSQTIGYPLVGRLEEPDGFGAVLDAGSSVVSDVAARCAEGFGRSPRVWGDIGKPARRVAFCSGSLGSLRREALGRGCDCVVAGECGYHVALDLEEAGLAVILLGHDVSELPFAGLLARTIGDSLPGLDVVVLDERVHWQTHTTGE